MISKNLEKGLIPESNPKFFKYSIVFILISIITLSLISFFRPPLDAQLIPEGFEHPKPAVSKKPLRIKRYPFNDATIRQIKIDRTKKKYITYSYLYRDVIAKPQLFVEQLGEWKPQIITNYNLFNLKVEIQGLRIFSKNRMSDRTSILKVFKRNLPGLRNLFIKHLVGGYSINGIRDIHLTILPKGNVQKITITNSPFPQSDFNSAIIQRISLWKFFPAPQKQNVDRLFFQLMLSHKNVY